VSTLRYAFIKGKKSYPIPIISRRKRRIAVNENTSKLVFTPKGGLSSALPPDMTTFAAELRSQGKAAETEL
jgi:DNA topoisomerase IB